MDGYSIVGTDQTELSTDTGHHAVRGHVRRPIGSFARKAAFALRFGEIEPLISANLTDKSKVIYIRDVKERVQSGPVPAARRGPLPRAGGRRDQVRDRRLHDRVELPLRPGATTRPRSTRSHDGTFNYLRNSVKAAVDAYDGTVTLYLTDTLYGEKDPIIRAYAKAFPDLFTADIRPSR